MTAVVMLPIKTISEANSRDHWAKKASRVKLHRQTARTLVKPHPLPCIVTMTRYSPGTLDTDNLNSALKAARDGVADKLGVPDNDPRIEWRYAQAKAKRGEFGLQIRIEAKP